MHHFSLFPRHDGVQNVGQGPRGGAGWSQQVEFIRFFFCGEKIIDFNRVDAPHFPTLS